MTGLHKINLKKLFFALIPLAAFVAITAKGEARHIIRSGIYSTLTRDTTPPPPKRKLTTPQKRDSSRTTRPRDTAAVSDTIPPRDTVPTVQRIDTFSVKLSKDTLDAPINYEAEDSAVLLVRQKKFILYGRTKTTYKDIVLTAPRVEMDQQTNNVTAYNAVDTSGNVETRAVFTQGTESFQSDTIVYNFKTQKGLTRNTYTRTSEAWVKGDYIKKVNANTSFVKRMVMTTCDYDDPHFGFVANKGKFISGKVAITGPVHPEFEGIPIPLYLPFGFFPLNPGRHSGLLPPQFVVNQQFGLGLEGLGYYHVLNDYLDVTVRTNIYSYGGWSAMITPTYRKRYKYNGAFSFHYQHTKVNFKGDPDYSLNKTYNISWNHTMDPKAKPGISFSANVNAGSTQFNNFIPNNPIRNITNSQTSSISYSKTWKDKPFNLTLAANQNQNSNTHLVNITLPEASFNVTTIYPLQRKTILGSKRWYENIGIGYNGNLRNQIAFYDTAKNSVSSLVDTLQWGIQHRFPLTMALPPIFGGKLILSPSIGYEETWLPNRIRRRWNAAENKIDTVTVEKGLFIDRQINFGLSLSTNIFGTYQFRGSSVKAIRHVIRPTFSINYRPNLSKNKHDVLLNNQGNQLILSQFDNNTIVRGYGYGEFGGISFGVDNNLEMKVRGKKDSVDRKVRLIDGFGFNGSYNFLSDSFQLSNLGLYLRSTLFEKLNLTANANLDPYEYDENGNRVNRFAWASGGRPGFSFGNVLNGSVAMSTQFRSEPRDPRQAANPNAQLGRRMQTDPTLAADQQRLMEYAQRNPAEFVDFNIPWSIDLSFSLNFNRLFDRNEKRFRTDINAGTNFNSSFSLTPKWNFSTTGFYDFGTKQMTQFSMSISRDMHCWQMAISVTPIGNIRFFNITISPKSSILQDLRINRTRTFVNF